MVQPVVRGGVPVVISVVNLLVRTADGPGARVRAASGFAACGPDSVTALSVGAGGRTPLS